MFDGINHETRQQVREAILADCPVPEIFNPLERALLGDLLKNLPSGAPTVERQLDVAVQRLADLRDRLLPLLNPEQVEAASIAGMSPEAYAIELLKMKIGVSK